MKTFNIHFDDDNDSNDKGLKESFQYCIDYIQMHNGSNTSYFEDYKGGTVSIVCNETGETIYSTTVN